MRKKERVNVTINNLHREATQNEKKKPCPNDIKA